MKELVDLLGDISARSKKATVFTDLIEMMAISFRNSIDGVNWQEREDKYLKIINKYNKKEVEQITKIIVMLIKEMDRNPRDILGELYMQSEIGSKELGQFFTPSSLSEIVVNTTFKKDDIQKEINEKGYIKLMEPTVGSGVFIISFVNKMVRSGFDISTQLLVDATDLDITAVYMSYIHLSLLGVSAKIKHSDVLSNEIMDVWVTPNYLERRNIWES